MYAIVTGSDLDRIPLHRRLWAVVRIVRPVNVCLFLVGAALGGWLVAGLDAFRDPLVSDLMIAAVSATLMGAGANVINDVFDLEIDRINRPGRPLPQGLLSPGFARTLWAVLSVAGIVLGSLLSFTHVILALLTVSLCFLYSAGIKHRPLVGNLLVALVTPLTLIVYAGMAVGPALPALVAAGFAFMVTLMREIVKDIQDVRGDATAHSRTLPLIVGTTQAGWVAAALGVVTIGLTPLPYLSLGYSGLYLFMVFVTDLVLMRAVWLVGVSDAGFRAPEASKMIKLAMLLGIVALAAGKNVF